MKTCWDKVKHGVEQIGEIADRVGNTAEKVGAATKTGLTAAGEVYRTNQALVQQFPQIGVLEQKALDGSVEVCKKIGEAGSQATKKVWDNRAQICETAIQSAEYFLKCAAITGAILIGTSAGCIYHLYK